MVVLGQKMKIVYMSNSLVPKLRLQGGYQIPFKQFHNDIKTSDSITEINNKT